jgi:hypothetical protein
MTMITDIIHAHGIYGPVHLSHSSYDRNYDSYYKTRSEQEMN